MNSILGSVVPLAMFLSFHYCRKKKKHWGMRKIRGIDSIKKAEGRKQSVDRKDNHSTISLTLTIPTFSQLLTKSWVDFTIAKKHEQHSCNISAVQLIPGQLGPGWVAASSWMSMVMQLNNSTEQFNQTHQSDILPFENLILKLKTSIIISVECSMFRK